MAGPEATQAHHESGIVILLERSFKPPVRITLAGNYLLKRVHIPYVNH